MSEQASDRPRVLIVDDESSARDALEALLYQEGYELAFARDGYEALSAIADAPPDTVLLDVMMPNLDGFEVCRHIKGDARWQHISVVLVTALDSKEDIVRGLDAGADEFLSKPVNGPELRARVRTMLRIKSQYDQLREALRMREDLTNMIVHDMRDPLTTLLALSNLLLDTAQTPEMRSDLEGIHAAALRLGSFLNDMLMLAKMQAGKMLLRRIIVDVNQLVRGVARSHAAVAQAYGIELIADLPEQSREILADANLLQRVLDNLLSNALKFSPADTTVTVRVAYPLSGGKGADGYAVRIQVLDEGPGIAREERERLFRQFEVADLARHRGAQIGLGLAFCKMVVQAHGGRISVQANEPRGSVFTVEL